MWEMFYTKCSTFAQVPPSCTAATQQVYYDREPLLGSSSTRKGNHAMAASHPRLRWHTDRQAYELEEEGRSVSPPFPFDDNGWFAWLEGVSSFSFQGQQGQLTVRKEARPRGAQYWYAYRRIGPKMAKKYLGRSADLTLARLEEVAAAFPSAAGSTAEPAEPSHAIPMDEQRLPHDPLLATKLHPPRPRSRLSPVPTSSSACSRAWSLP